MLGVGLQMLLLVGAAGTPEPPPKARGYELSWAAPAACPTEDEIRARIAALAAPSPDGVGVLVIDASVSQTSEGFTLALRSELGERVDTRHLRHAECDPLGDSTALVVAVALDPTLGGGDPPPAEPPPPMSDDPTAPATIPIAPTDRGTSGPPSSSSAAQRGRPRTTPPVASPQPSRRRRLRAPQRLALRLGPGLEVGSLPGVGGGTELAVALVWRRLRLEVLGNYLWPRRSTTTARGAALVQLGGAGVRGCARPSVRSVVFPLCLGVRAAAVRIDSRGLSPSRSLHGPWVGPTGSAGVAWAGERIGVWTAAELGVAAASTQVLVGPDVAFRPLPVSIRLGVGLEIFFSIDPTSGGQGG